MSVEDGQSTSSQKDPNKDIGGRRIFLRTITSKTIDGRPRFGPLRFFSKWFEPFLIASVVGLCDKITKYVCLYFMANRA